LIKKLKFKFVLTNMLLIALILLSSLAFIYFQNASFQRDKTVSAMQNIADDVRNSPNFLFRPDKEAESDYSYLPAVIIDIDATSGLCYIDGFGDGKYLTEKETQYVTGILNAIKKEGKTEGVLVDYNMRFLCKTLPIGTRIVLVDKQYEDENMRQLMISLSIIGSCALIGFLIISFVVANIAIKPVEKSIKQQNQLISNVSHDLKTPITIISTNADILLSSDNNIKEEDQKWLRYIKDEADKMSEIVNMTLYLAKSDEPTSKPKLTDINLSNIAYDIALPFESVCFENGKLLDINIQNDIFIKADEYSLKQLFSILLDNAVKYSNANGRIVFTAHIVNDKAVVSVYNTGEPIPKNDLPFIFDRFYRADEARSRTSSGSGLGLSIAKRIIENNEASISVTSNIEHGTMFTCSFNLLKKKDLNN